MSPDFWAFMPVRAAMDRACARGEPPPHAMVSKRFLVSAIDRVGGTRTSAASPWKGISEIWSRLWYASVSNDKAAPLAACMRFRAMLPDASTTKIIKLPALRAMRFDRTSLSSMKTLRPMYFFWGFACCLSRLGFWYGADARIVASTANLLTLPRGNWALM